MTWETYLWGDNGGIEYRNFTSHRVSTDFLQASRDFMSLILFAQLGITWFHDHEYTLLFLTNWGLHFVYISLRLNYQATNDQITHPGQVTGFRKWRWRLAVIMFQMALTIEIVLSMLFWAFLWNPPQVWNFKEIFNATTHSFPALFLIFDFFVQKWVFRWNHIWFIIFVALFYGIVNFIFVELTGWYIYPILHWDDIASFILMGIALMLAVFLHGFFFILSLINRKVFRQIPLYVPVLYVRDIGC
mmetsp:Transcript_33627/g.33082  ORF Transcript_33627/g.33082 Transcript_33627/m.33082 type:complete len:245 (-) Transcript_33627:22-756(-)